MIDTVLFDMGGTLEDIFVDEESRQAASREVVRILQKNGIRVTADERAAAEMLAAGWDRYAAYRDPEWWSRAAIWNVAHAGKFSSDRTIQQYVDEIWHLKKIER